MCEVLDCEVPKFLRQASLVKDTAGIFANVSNLALDDTLCLRTTWWGDGMRDSERASSRSEFWG